MNIVRVIAEDWAQYTSMTEIVFPFEVSVAEVVGFLVQEDNDKVVLSHQLFPRDDTTDDVRYTSVIPKKMIKKMEILKK